MNKKKIREDIKALRNSLDKAQRLEMDKRICKALIRETESFEDILCYISSQIEVDTRGYISYILENTDKTLYAPRCVKGTNVMYFYRIKSLDDLEEGYFGILEPKEHCEKLDVVSAQAVCIVPALSFDERGYRVGFGKGFYDRFLSDFEGKTIGICYECCMTDTIENDIYDISVGKVITDKRDS